MENKYYTPEPVDLCIGYKCEIKHYDDPWHPEGDFTWKKVILSEDVNFNHEYPGYCFSELQYGSLRTKYLTQEDIEAEGWKSEPNMGFEKLGILKFSKDKYEMTYIIGSRDAVISKYTPSTIIFQGQITSINEFRTVLKLLKIK